MLSQDVWLYRVLNSSWYADIKLGNHIEKPSNAYKNQIQRIRSAYNHPQKSIETNDKILPESSISYVHGNG